MKTFFMAVLGAVLVLGLQQFVPSLTAQPSAPAAINGCVYLSVMVTLTNFQQTPFICDQNGRLRVTTTQP